MTPNHARSSSTRFPVWFRKGLAGLLVGLLAAAPSLFAQPIGGAAPLGANGANAGRTVQLNFDQVELKQLIRLVSDNTGKRFIIDDAIAGKRVTLVAPEKIPVDELFDFSLSILESMGYAAIEKEGGYELVALPARTANAGSFVPGAGELPNAGFITKVFKLKNVEAEPLRKVLEKMVRGGAEGAVQAFPANNTIIVTDTATNLKRVAAMIADLDTSETASTIEVVKLKHSSATELARTLSNALSASQSAGKAFVNQIRSNTGGGTLPSSITVVPAEQSQSLILVGAPAKIAETKRIIEILDVETAAGRGRLNAIRLNYLRAPEIAKTLTSLLEKRGAKKEWADTIAIEADTANNALLIDANALDYEYIRTLVTDLDRAPKQVLVEVMIAEIGIERGVDLGVEWDTIDTPRDGSTTVAGRSRPGAIDEISSLVTDAAFGQGLSLGLARGFVTGPDGRTVPRVPFLLRALAQDRDVKILSNVPLLAQDNNEAKVSVVENIPVLRSTIEGGSGTARDVIQNIDRIDVGIQMTLTPRITPDNKVILDLNPSIEAIIDQGDPNQPFTPTIAKREVDTTVTIPDRATVVISGLLREDVIKEERRVPVLGSIPVLGNLFKSVGNRKQRTNLLIFVTPTIIGDDGTASEVERNWELKTGLSPRLQFEKIPVEPKSHWLDPELKP